jgi:hypothetical protein
MEHDPRAQGDVKFKLCETVVERNETGGQERQQRRGVPKAVTWLRAGSIAFLATLPLSNSARPELLAAAELVPRDSGDRKLVHFPGLGRNPAAQEKFAEVQFSHASSGGAWIAGFIDRDAYMRAADAIKDRQPAKAGPRLAAAQFNLAVARPSAESERSKCL